MRAALLLVLALAASCSSCASTGACKDAAALCSSRLIICADTGECSCLGNLDDGEDDSPLP